MTAKWTMSRSDEIFVNREPRMVEMTQSGDSRRFLCLMDIGGEIYGGTFRITARDEQDPKAWVEGLLKAWGQAKARIDLAKPNKDGSSWDEFNAEIE
jgi:hypothetical protein